MMAVYWAVWVMDQASRNNKKPAGSGRVASELETGEGDESAYRQRRCAAVWMFRQGCQVRVTRRLFRPAVILSTARVSLTTTPMAGKIVIAGAGSIGCFVGGLLVLGGAEVTLLGRARIVDTVSQDGLHLTSFEGWEEQIASDRFHATTDPAQALACAGTVIVTVKSGQTGDMAAVIAAHAPADAEVISLQNGLGNAARLRAALPGRQVFAGMVGFNVLNLGRGRFHRGTSGPIVLEEVDGVRPLFIAPHLELLCHARMDAVLAGKLVYNLNNALNALSGLTLRDQLADRRWRLLLAAAQEEALTVFRAEGIHPWSLGKIPVTRFPRLLRLPDLLFRLVSRRGVRIDASARSSMWEDLQRGRPTEIDELQGAVIDRAAALGLRAPVNRAIAGAIRAAEANKQGSPLLDPGSLLRQLS
jgi:2-dehydropantoate 2-reductase